MLAQTFVHYLPVSACLAKRHQHPLYCRKRSVFGQVSYQGSFINPQSLNQPQACTQGLVGDQERLRQHAASVCRIVQGAFEQ